MSLRKGSCGRLSSKPGFVTDAGSSLIGDVGFGEVPSSAECLAEDHPVDVASPIPSGRLVFGNL